MSPEYVFVSDSVTAAHPDKLCDRISDEIVDRLLEQDPAARIMAECALFGGVVFLATRCATSASIDLSQTARRVIENAGYRAEDYDAANATVLTSSLGTLPEHYPAVDVDQLTEEEIQRIPAGNQANVFGFATRQSPSLMPLPIVLAHRLARRLEEVAKSGDLPYLMPDGKSQVAVAYRDRVPRRIHSLSLVACQGIGREVAAKRLRDDLVQRVIAPVFADAALAPDDKTDFFFNPEGPFVGGGPKVHCGLTGRKTAIDTYGEYARRSGSALSGKDPLRIDRVGAYAARYVAKHIVAAGLADDCEVQLTYTPGEAAPLSIQVQTSGTGKIADQEIESLIRRHFDLRPAGIVRSLRLQRVARTRGGFYRHLSAYGHMGREDLEVPWERLDRVEALRAG